MGGPRVLITNSFALRLVVEKQLYRPSTDLEPHGCGRPYWELYYRVATVVAVSARAIPNVEAESQDTSIWPGRSPYSQQLLPVAET